MSGIATVQGLVFDLIFVAVFVLCLVALIDLLRRPARAFVNGGKRTKGFWGAIVGAATAVSFVAIPPLNARITFLVVLAAVGATVYLVDVRPAVAPYSGRGGRSGRGGPAGGW